MAETKLTGKFHQGRGGRKSCTAQVRIYPKKSGFVINDKDFEKYFPKDRQQKTVLAPFKVTETKDTFGVSVKVVGGGVTGQAEAIRHGISRALVDFDEELRKKLKREGFLTRDQRVVERKKYGLKKARRAPQWSKR